MHVDKILLRARIRKLLQTRTQVSLAEILAVHPLDQGLAEVVAYMSLAADDIKALIDGGRKQTVVWSDAALGPRQATIPLVVFTR